MNLLLKRNHGTKDYTSGSLFVDGVFECYTLEDEERLVKIKGKTAINCGFYKVIINHSNHFGKNLPLLLDVPNFEGVRIHPGNTAADTEGCILVGRALKKDVLTESRAAFSPLFVKMTIALSEREPINIIIE